MSDQPLRPHVVRAGGKISGITAWRDGYAVTTPKALELYDASLVLTRALPTEAGSHVVVLDDGRIVAGGSTLCVFGDSGPMGEIELGEYCSGLLRAPDGRGFYAVGSDRVVFDREGKRTTAKLTEYPSFGTWSGGLAVADRNGLRLFDHGGAEVASATEYLTKKPIAIGGVLVVKGLSTLLIYDESARQLGSLDSDAANVFGFAGGVAIETSTPEGDKRFSYLELAGDSLVERWHHDASDYASCTIVGSHLVLHSDKAVRIFDPSGMVRGKLEGVGYVGAVTAFEDGIVVCGHHRLVWWRPNHEIDLEYDGSLGHLRTVPAGLACSEDDVLLVWRTDLQGPAPELVTTDLPMGVPIVVDGSHLTVEAAQRFSLRVRYPKLPDTHSRPPHYRAWRHPTTREQAIVVRDRLITRVFDGPLPSIPADVVWHEVRDDIAQLPLADTVDLVGRGMFSLSGLDPEMQKYAASARAAFFSELATALRTSPSLLIAAIRARKLKLEPPRLVIGYDYLGTFTTSGALTAADPCYLGRKETKGFSLTQKMAAAEGLWHVFVRAAKEEPGRNAELVTVHESAFEVYASDLVGNIGVDAGCAGVFDKACPKPDLDFGIDEGVVSGRGAVAWSGYGDGMYPVFAGTTAGKVSKIRIVFIDDAPDVDRLIAKVSTGTAKPYSASKRFAIGDNIEHPKFGVGAVIKVADAKIDVRFADAARTLVHAKK